MKTSSLLLCIGIALPSLHAASEAEIRSLADLDDRTLKDIGLIRSDVSGALAEPFYRNPSTVLVRSVEHDRRTRRTFAERTIRPIVPMVKDETLP